METYDVAAYEPNPTGGVATQALATPANTGQLVSGGNKLAQRFSCRFMLIKGSIPYLPKAGCNFLNILQITGASTEADVFMAFAGAMIDLNAQLAAEQLSTDPPDESFASAQLNSVTITPSQLELDVTVTSLAGTPVNLTLPLQFDLQ